MSESGESGMQFERQLYIFRNVGIRVDIRLGFEGEKLKLDGYDIGETVRAIRGDSDYEYSISVAREDLEKLHLLSGIEVGGKKELVDHLARSFSSNEAFSSFRDYLLANEVRCAVFTWS